jgi:hypothetical protein
MMEEPPSEVLIVGPPTAITDRETLTLSPSSLSLDAL